MPDSDSIIMTVIAIAYTGFHNGAAYTRLGDATLVECEQLHTL